MESRNTTAGLLVLAVLGGCGSSSGDGSGGGGTPNPGTQSLTGNLSVLGHSPEHGAVQVAPDVVVRIEFDAAVVADCLADPGTGLWDAAGNPVAGTFSQEQQGATVVFTPSNPLAEATNYSFLLSPFTCDGRGRIVDAELRIDFRTIDRVPPVVTAMSPAQGQTGVSRNPTLQVTFNEALAPTSITPATVQLRDGYGANYAVDITVVGRDLTVVPAADLPGNRSLSLRVQGVEDLAGNRLTGTARLDFSTTSDTTAPLPVSVWPSSPTAMSPNLHPVLTFSESMDPTTVEQTSVLFVDEYANIVRFRVAASRDQRSLRLIPESSLVRGRIYALTTLTGAGAVTDVSGNTLAQQQQFGFVIGDDATPPGVTASQPLAGAVEISLNSDVRLTFGEPLDPTRIDATRFRLTASGTPVAASVALDNSGATVRITPVDLLVAGGNYTVTVIGGPEGVRDVAGNPMAADFATSFRTTADPTVPAVLLAPSDGNNMVPTSITLSALFDESVDPATVDGTTVHLAYASGTPVPGTVTVARGDRVVRLVPSVPLRPRSAYVFTVVGGENGVREASGNWLAIDAVTRFTTAAQPDVTPPDVTVTLNGIDEARKDSLTLPGAGFDIDVTAIDRLEYSLDMSTVEVVLSGNGTVPGVETIFAAAAIDGSTLHYRMPYAAALAPGSYEIVARVRDLSGNVGASQILAFRVENADPGAQPFERTQIVWVRFDLDRNGNGIGDHEDDMTRLGLIAAGDPAGTNVRMLALLRDAILTQTHAMLGRDATGAPRGSGAVAIRLSWRRIPGAPQSQIACGGLDPEGDPSRAYGQSSTGTLGRAYFDYRNGNMTDINTGTSPGLGVFPGELFLFEARLHSKVYPSYTTTFARSFLNLAPRMGGTPAGAHSLDRIVLAAGFDPTTANSSQRARYHAVFDAADDWATAVGIILAHEIGHAVGLVARGGNPRGLHGDNSLHNEFPTATDIMGSAVGYDSLISLSYGFRDLNMTYLRQRLLMK